MKDNKMKKSRFIGETIIIAAIYVLLSMVSDMFGMATGPLRIRISEALCTLTYYTGAAVPGLFIGSLISNALFVFKNILDGGNDVAFVITSSAIKTILVASCTTLVAAFISFLIRKTKWIVAAPNIIITMFVIPYTTLYIQKMFDDGEYTYWNLFLLTGIGEVVTAGLLGIALLLALEDYREKLFPRAKIIIEPSDELKNAEGIVASDSILPKEEDKVNDSANSDVSKA